MVPPTQFASGVLASWRTLSRILTPVPAGVEPLQVDLVANAAAVPLVLAIGLAGVHLVARRCRVLELVPRVRFLSFAGGVSVSYVFVHVLPELGQMEGSLGGVAAVLTTAEGGHIVAMLGFVAYYGLERFARRSAEGEANDRPTRGVFWVHVGSFAAYNGIVGYLLFHRETPGLENLVLFAVAIGLHFVVNDYSLQEDHADIYVRTGRWILAAAVIVGGVIGFLTEVDPVYLGLLFAFVGGGIVLNVIKEELPGQRDSSFPAFGLGIVGYTALLLAV